MMKYLLNWIVKLPKEAFVDDKVYTFKVTQSRWTYGRKSNRTSPRGQRIRAKQQTMKGIELADQHWTTRAGVLRAALHAFFCRVHDLDRCGSGRR